jgi:hypothetical protein
MANKRHKPEEIVTKQRQVEVLVGQVMARIDAISEVWIFELFYQLRIPIPPNCGGKKSFELF